MEMSGYLHALAALTREIAPVPSAQDAGWSPEPVWRFGGRENLLTLQKFEPRTVQPIA